MTIFNFYDKAASPANRFPFMPGTDRLYFDNAYSAADLRFRDDPLGLYISHGGEMVQLQGVTFAQLTSTMLLFANGSLALLDTSAGQTLNGTTQSDYVDIRKGGNDSVTLEAGNDYIYAGNALNGADAISGGPGPSPTGDDADTLVLSGKYANPVALTAATITDIENIVLEKGTSIALILNNATVSTADGGVLTVDASELGIGDSLRLDGSQVTSGKLILTGGAGSDVLVGGAGNDLLTGSVWAGLETGWAGGDKFTGGAGDDTFVFHPLSPYTPDPLAQTTFVNEITDFQGAGIAGGDLIDLAIPFGGLIFNQMPLAQPFDTSTANNGPLLLDPAYAHDGFTDVSWVRNVAANRVEVWVDTNDDGKLSKSDLLIYLDGATSLTGTDFVNDMTWWRGTAGNDDHTFGDSDATGFGLGGNDRMTGGPGYDSLYGGDGDDSISGNGGGDWISGGTGNDTLSGGDGNDKLYGEDGSDTLSGGNGDDELFAGDEAAQDTAGSVNVLNGDAGKDKLYGGNATDILNGGSDYDQLFGYRGDDQLNGGDGDDDMFGGDGNDTLNGGNGVDWMWGEAGKDTLTGGKGADLFIYDYATDSSFAAPDRITDLSRTDGDKIWYEKQATGMGSLQVAFRGKLPTGTPYAVGTVLPQNPAGAGFIDVWWTTRTGGGVVLLADTNFDGLISPDDFAVEINGLVDMKVSDFADDSFALIAGTAGNDTLYGAAGNDTLYGGAGVDRLDGQAGADAMFGGQGNDTYVVDNIGDTVTEDLGEGTDTVNSSVSFTLGANVENLVLTGAATTEGTGNDLANAITGNAANNILSGGAGNDSLKGGGGNDTLFGGTDNDTLDGGTGADSMFGGTGNDTYVVDDAGDSVNEEASAGTDGVKASISYTLGANVENLTLTGTANINGTGNGLANSLTGNNGNNYLSGGAGADKLSGGSGDDVLVGGIGNDSLTGGTGADVFILALDGSLDSIADFSPTLGDTIRFDRVSFGIPAGAAIADYVTLSTAPNNNHGYILALNTGIYWDADGTGSGASVKIASFSKAPVGMTFSNFSFS